MANRLTKPQILTDGQVADYIRHHNLPAFSTVEIHRIAQRDDTFRETLKMVLKWLGNYDCWEKSAHLLKADLADFINQLAGGIK